MFIWKVVQSMVFLLKVYFSGYNSMLYTFRKCGCICKLSHLGCHIPVADPVIPPLRSIVIILSIAVSLTIIWLCSLGKDAE